MRRAGGREAMAPISEAVSGAVAMSVISIVAGRIPLGDTSARSHDRSREAGGPADGPDDRWRQQRVSLPAGRVTRSLAVTYQANCADWTRNDHGLNELG